MSKVSGLGKSDPFATCKCISKDWEEAYTVRAFPLTRAAWEFQAAISISARNDRFSNVASQLILKESLGRGNYREGLREFEMDNEA